MTRVAICAPATPITPDVARQVTALAAANLPGLTLSFHEQCFASEGHFAGSDDLRLAAFLECANDPAFEAVWFARGGYGSNRIAARAIASMNGAAGDKTYLGFSDCGFLLAGLYREGIGRPAHGPMPVNIRSDCGGAAVLRSLSWLSGGDDGLEPGLDDRPTVAFNLMTLAAMTGTPLMPDLAGHVVIVEEVAEHLYAIDRLFFHVVAHLQGIVGLRLGTVTAVPDNDRPFGSEAEDIARYWCAAAGIPYLGRAQVGHDPCNRIVPFGLAAKGERA
jgi:muramoyltetrapeptide carboxypeptidase